MSNFNNLLIIKAGSLLPVFFVQLLNSNSIPIDLTNAINATFRMRLEDSTVLAINSASMTFVNKPLGQLQYAWVAGDTDAGAYLAEVQVNYPFGGPLIMPTDGYYHILIKPSLP